MAGNKNSGRRTLEKELEYTKDRIKQVAIEDLATSKVYNHLENINYHNDKGVKDIALPVYLKSKADKVNLSGKLIIQFNGLLKASQGTGEDSGKSS